MKILVWVMVVIWVVGCSGTSGRKIDDSSVSVIKKNKTTTAEVLSLFGTPYERQVFGDGVERWSYHFAEASMNLSPLLLLGIASGESHGVVLNIVFERDVVRECTHIESRRQESETVYNIRTGSEGGNYTIQTPCWDLPND